jgi:ferredoxin
LDSKGDFEMKKSTEDFRKLFGEEKEALGKFFEGYIYGRWPDLYLYHLRKLASTFVPDPEVVLRYPAEIGTPELDELTQTAVQKTLMTLMSPETSTYHSKVVKLDDARKLVTLNRDISLTNLETVIPYQHARDIILKNPDHIAVIDCTCRSTKENPCEPLDVCLAIGEPFAGFVLEHGTNNARKISQEEAVEILKAEDERGHVHTAWFKDAMGDRFYAICNCCKCCCGAMRAHFQNVPIIAPSGYVSEISDECDGCGECAGYCQFGAITIEDKAVVNHDKCMGCGVCESKCPAGAISLRRDPTKSEPLDIVALSQ